VDALSEQTPTVIHYRNSRDSTRASKPLKGEQVGGLSRAILESRFERIHSVDQDTE
jgi:hypothetical protein